MRSNEGSRATSIEPPRGWRRLLRTGLLVLGALLLAALLIEPHRLIVREFEVVAEGVGPTPVRILVFADVGFRGEGRRERRLRQLARELRPDLILVAGDFLDRVDAIRDPDLLAAARDYLRSLPAGAGRVLVPGEEEAREHELIARSFGAAGIAVLSAESRRIQVGETEFDLFGADPAVDPAPWGLSDERGRRFLYSRGRWLQQSLIYRGPGAEQLEDIELTLAFQALDPESYLDIRFGWTDGSGWHLLRNGYEPTLRLRPKFPGEHTTSGRRDSGFDPPAGVWCRARLQIEDDGHATRIRARFWREGSPEPATWMIDAEHRGPDRRHAGSIGFGGREGGRRYADLRVARMASAPLIVDPFADADLFRRTWSASSRLAHWLHEPASSAVRLLLSHNPDVALDVVAIDGATPALVLAGHTHGGQIRLPGIGALYTDTELGRKYAAGPGNYQGVPLYVTAGVGTSFLPIRLFNPPEITLVTLRAPP